MDDSHFPSLWQMMSGGIYVLLFIVVVMIVFGAIMAGIDLVARLFGLNRNDRPSR